MIFERADARLTSPSAFMRIKFTFLLYKTNRFHVCSVIDHRRRQNVVRTSVTHSAIASCATFLFLPHFDVICDLLLTDARQHGIYLLNGSIHQGDRRFSDVSRGRQCAFRSLSAVLCANSCDVSQWTAHTVDQLFLGCT